MGPALARCPAAQTGIELGCREIQTRKSSRGAGLRWVPTPERGRNRRSGGEGAGGGRLAATSGPPQLEEKESELTFPRETGEFRRALPKPGKQVSKGPPSSSLCRLPTRDKGSLESKGRDSGQRHLLGPKLGGRVWACTALCTKRNPNSQKSQEEILKNIFSFHF